MAQKWLEWGATAIVGSHSHRQQPAVRYGNKIVDYSLGNFAFYVRNGDGLNSGIGYLTIAPTGEVVNALVEITTGVINTDSFSPNTKPLYVTVNTGFADP